MSRETPRQFIDSVSSSCKRRKHKGGRSKDSATSDPLLDMLHEVQHDLKGVASNVGKMTATMEREAAIQEKVMNDNPQRTLREKAVGELRKLGFTRTKQMKAIVFMKMSEQLSMLLTLKESLRREFILNMLNGMIVDL
jgi:gamma-glutamylcysteine synthetase